MWELTTTGAPDFCPGACFLIAAMSASFATLSGQGVSNHHSKIEVLVPECCCLLTGLGAGRWPSYAGGQGTDQRTNRANSHTYSMTAVLINAKDRRSVSTKQHCTRHAKAAAQLSEGLHPPWHGMADHGAPLTCSMISVPPPRHQPYPTAHPCSGGKTPPLCTPEQPKSATLDRVSSPQLDVECV